MLLMPVAFIVAIGQIAVHDVLALFWLCPLVILGFAAVVARERIGWPVWLGAAVSIVGAQLVLHPDAGTLHTRALLALVMGGSFSLYVVLTRMLRTQPHTTSLIYTALCVCVPLSFVMPAVWKMPSLQDALIMTTIGVVGLILLWALDRVCEVTQAGAFAVLLPLQVVCEVLLTMVIVGGSTASRSVLAGCALIVGAAIIGLGIRHVMGSRKSGSVEQTKSQHG